jgi:flagellar basal-body rod protein FlgG
MSMIEDPSIAALSRFLDLSVRRSELVMSNMANIDTPGFRKRRIQFEDLLYQNVVMPGTAATQQTTFAAGLQVGLGTRTATSEIV